MDSWIRGRMPLASRMECVEEQEQAQGHCGIGPVRCVHDCSAPEAASSATPPKCTNMPKWWPLALAVQAQWVGKQARQEGVDRVVAGSDDSWSCFLDLFFFRIALPGLRQIDCPGVMRAVTVGGETL